MIPFRKKMKRLSAHILSALILAATLSCEKTPEPVKPSDKPVTPDPPTPTQVVDYDKYQLKELAAKAGLKLGVSFTYWEYRNNSINGNNYVDAILRRDFAAVTFGNEMKHDAIVTANGGYNFTQADQMVSWAKGCGNELFGHTLGWHSQQNSKWSGAANIRMTSSPVTMPRRRSPTGPPCRSMWNWKPRRRMFSLSGPRLFPEKEP